MTTDLRELYQQVILDHSKRPRNFREMNGATHEAKGHNPLCGDRVTVYCSVKGDEIKDLSFTGSGCAICTSSSSMMTEILKGKTIDQAEQVFGRFRDLVTGQTDVLDMGEQLDKLAVFSGVCEFPIRVKCATLPWHTMKLALEKRNDVASTE